MRQRRSFGRLPLHGNDVQKLTRTGGKQMRNKRIFLILIVLGLLVALTTTV
jgi:hypothetical protein